MTSSYQTALAWCIALAVVTPVSAAGDRTDLERPGLPVTDAAFVTGAGQAVNAELIAAKLALTKSSNRDVHAFARSMILENGRESAALGKLGTAVGHAAPTGVDTAQAASAQKMRTLSGAAFDKAYVDSEVGGHTLDIDKNFRPELASGGNAAVKKFATTYEASEKSQLQQAEALQTHDHL